MTLTPSDIEQKTFSTALRGYNLDEVDDFLDEVVRSMRKLNEELETARSELEAKSAEPDDVAESAPTPPPAVVEAPPPPPPPPAPVAPIDESAVGKALISAQETAERIVNDARSEADEILVRAKNEAETFEESRQLRKEEAEQEITRIDGLVNRVKAELADLSVAVGAELDEMSGAIDTAITDLDAGLGVPVDTEDDPVDEEDDVADDHHGQNIVGVGAEPLEGDDDGADEEPSGRRRHVAASGAIEATDVSDPEDDSQDDSDEDSQDDSEDDAEDDYFNFPEGDDDEDDESDSRA